LPHPALSEGEGNRFKFEMHSIKPDILNPKSFNFSDFDDKLFKI
jgi:hypothetical protein